MASRWDLFVLRRGETVWNRWREANPRIKLDLSGTNLSGTNLSGTNLSQANLSRAILSRAVLWGADLRQADLSRAILIGANLSRAILIGANLSRANLNWTNLSGANLSGAVLWGAVLWGADLKVADLSGADLSGADLKVADLRWADLSGADLSGAVFGATVVGAVDLRDVQGLDTVKHVGPSTIGIDTLYASGGNIPETFLHGCGVPDSMIEYARALVAAERPIDYYSVFISYSSHDEALAERLHADLQAKGVRCWFAPEDLKIGDSIFDGIDQGIRLHEKLLIILSESSLLSAWVEREVRAAQAREVRERRRVLFPIRLDDAVQQSDQAWAAELWDQRKIGDFRQWKDHDAYQAAFARLLRDLQATPDR